MKTSFSVGSLLKIDCYAGILHQLRYVVYKTDMIISGLMISLLFINEYEEICLLNMIKYSLCDLKAFTSYHYGRRKFSRLLRSSLESDFSYLKQLSMLIDTYMST
jgi:hypothetical protein